MSAQQRRLFSTAAEYDTIRTEQLYTPVREVKFSKDTYTVFNAHDCEERYFVPWKVKESAITNTFLISTAYLADAWINLQQGYPAIVAFCCLNYTYTVWNLMGNAVTKMDLHNDGKRVTLHFGKYAMIMGEKT